MGHAAPFAFDLDYRAGERVERMRVGTPPVIALAALEAALDAWEGVDMAELRRASIALGDLFIAERSEEHTSELQSLMRISYAVFCLKKTRVKRNTSSSPQ